MAKVGTQKILGVDCDIVANTMGQWRIEREGTTLGTGRTLEIAIDSARKTLNLSRIDVSVRFYTDKGVKGVATKIHAKTGNIMARVGGKSTQMDQNSRVFKPNTPRDVLARYNENAKEQVTLRTEARKIEHEYMFRLGTEVKKEVDAANKPNEDAA